MFPVEFELTPENTERIKKAGRAVFEELKKHSNDPLEQIAVLLFAIKAIEATAHIHVHGAVMVPRDDEDVTIPPNHGHA